MSGLVWFNWFDSVGSVWLVWFMCDDVICSPRLCMYANSVRACARIYTEQKSIP